MGNKRPEKSEITQGDPAAAEDRRRFIVAHSR